MSFATTSICPLALGALFVANAAVCPSATSQQALQAPSKTYITHDASRKGTMSISVSELLRQNLHEVFSQHDPEKRKAAIARLWSADAVFVDPDGQFRGAASVDAAIEKLQKQFPNFVFTEGKVQEYHGIGKLSWGFGPAGEEPKVTGIDVVVVSDGRIDALYTFLD